MMSCCAILFVFIAVRRVMDWEGCFSGSVQGFSCIYWPSLFLPLFWDLFSEICLLGPLSPPSTLFAVL